MIMKNAGYTSLMHVGLNPGYPLNVSQLCFRRSLKISAHTNSDSATAFIPQNKILALSLICSLNTSINCLYFGLFRTGSLPRISSFHLRNSSDEFHSHFPTIDREMNEKVFPEMNRRPGNLGRLSSLISPFARFLASSTQIQWKAYSTIRFIHSRDSQ